MGLKANTIATIVQMHIKQLGPTLHTRIVPWAYDRKRYKRRN